MCHTLLYSRRLSQVHNQLLPMTHSASRDRVAPKGRGSAGLPSRLPLVRLGWLPTRREEAADEEASKDEVSEEDAYRSENEEVSEEEVPEDEGVVSFACYSCGGDGNDARDGAGGVDACAGVRGQRQQLPAVFGSPKAADCT